MEVRFFKHKEYWHILPVFDFQFSGSKDICYNVDLEISWLIWSWYIKLYHEQSYTKLPF